MSSNQPPARFSEVLDRPVAFHRIFVDVAGSLDGAVLLGQILYWQRRLSPGREWFWKSDEQWFEELGIKRTALTSARKKLEVLGVIASEVKGFPRRRFYRLDFDALDRQIGRVLEQREAPELPLERPLDAPAAAAGRNQHTDSLQESTDCATGHDEAPGHADKSLEKQGSSPACRNQQTASLQESTTSVLKSTDSLQEPTNSPSKSTNCFIDYSRDYNRDYKTPPPAAGEANAEPVAANTSGRAVLADDPKRAMRLDWQPGAALWERCQLAGIPIDKLGPNRLGEILGEFRSYWSTEDLRLVEGKWQHKFLQHIVTLKNKNQLYASPQTGQPTKETSLSEELNDRSWATT